MKSFFLLLCVFFVTTFSSTAAININWTHGGSSTVTNIGIGRGASPSPGAMGSVGTISGTFAPGATGTKTGVGYAAGTYYGLSTSSPTGTVWGAFVAAPSDGGTIALTTSPSGFPTPHTLTNICGVVYNNTGLEVLAYWSEDGVDKKTELLPTGFGDTYCFDYYLDETHSFNYGFRILKPLLTMDSSGNPLLTNWTVSAGNSTTSTGVSGTPATNGTYNVTQPSVADSYSGLSSNGIIQFQVGTNVATSDEILKAGFNKLAVNQQKELEEMISTLRTTTDGFGGINTRLDDQTAALNASRSSLASLDTKATAANSSLASLDSKASSWNSISNSSANMAADLHTLSTNSTAFQGAILNDADSNLVWLSNLKLAIDTNAAQTDLVISNASENQVAAITNSAGQMNSAASNLVDAATNFSFALGRFTNSFLFDTNVSDRGTHDRLDSLLSFTNTPADSATESKVASSISRISGSLANLASVSNSFSGAVADWSGSAVGEDIMPGSLDFGLGVVSGMSYDVNPTHNTYISTAASAIRKFATFILLSSFLYYLIRLVFSCVSDGSAAGNSSSSEGADWGASSAVGIATGVSIVTICAASLVGLTTLVLGFGFSALLGNPVDSLLASGFAIANYFVPIPLMFSIIFWATIFEVAAQSVRLFITWIIRAASL